MARVLLICGFTTAMGGRSSTARVTPADENSTTINVLLNTTATPGGQPTFQMTPYGGLSNPISIAVKDFNGDGKLDLAVVNETGSSVSILQGNGDGTFQTQVSYAVGNAPNSVVAGDFNGDGKIDSSCLSSWFSTMTGEVRFISP